MEGVGQPVLRSEVRGASSVEFCFRVLPFLFAFAVGVVGLCSVFVEACFFD